MYINSVANSVELEVHLRHEFYNIIFKMTHKLHIASGSAPPCKIVGVDVTIVPIKSYNEIWPSETERDYNRQLFYSHDQYKYVQRWQESAIKRGLLLAQGFLLKHRIGPTVVQLREVCSFTLLAAFYINERNRQPVLQIRSLGPCCYLTISQNWAILHNQNTYYVVFVLIILLPFLIMDSWCFDTQVHAFRSERI
jgi:hypothetical protein